MLAKLEYPSTWLSSKPTENFWITKSGPATSCFSLSNYGNNLPKHSHHSSPQHHTTACQLQHRWSDCSFGHQTHRQPCFHSLHCVSKTASHNAGWWKKTSNLSCRCSELIAEHTNESHKYITAHHRMLVEQLAHLQESSEPSIYVISDKSPQLQQ